MFCFLEMEKGYQVLMIMGIPAVVMVTWILIDFLRYRKHKTTARALKAYSFYRPKPTRRLNMPFFTGERKLKPKPTPILSLFGALPKAVSQDVSKKPGTNDTPIKTHVPKSSGSGTSKSAMGFLKTIMGKSLGDQIESTDRKRQHLEQSPNAGNGAIISSDNGDSNVDFGSEPLTEAILPMKQDTLIRRATEPTIKVVKQKLSTPFERHASAEAQLVYTEPKSESSMDDTLDDSQNSENAFAHTSTAYITDKRPIKRKLSRASRNKVGSTDDSISDGSILDSGSRLESVTENDGSISARETKNILISVKS